MPTKTSELQDLADYKFSSELSHAAVSEIRYLQGITAGRSTLHPVDLVQNLYLNKFAVNKITAVFFHQNDLIIFMTVKNARRVVWQVTAVWAFILHYIRQIVSFKIARVL